MVAIDHSQVKAFARFLRDARDVQPFDFCSVNEGVLFPDRGAPGVLDYFFFCTAHQFGFWYLEHDHYHRPMLGRIDGIEYKGSDYLWRCATRAWAENRDLFSPMKLVDMTNEQWMALFADDEGHNPLPMWEEHLEIIRAYAAWAHDERLVPEQMLVRCHTAPKPLAAFLDAAGRIPGYREDPLRKKLLLLAVILENRPEKFLRVADPESYEPIIDYHLQRSALRTGLVEISDPVLKAKIERREVVSAEEERTIRQAVFSAIQMLVKCSGRSVAAIDYFFFLNRKRCPEMTEPECPVCPVNAICAHRTRLFQPVLRTADY